MKRFSRLLLIASLAIACLPLKQVAAASLLDQPAPIKVSAQTMQLAALPRKELCQYQNMSGGGRKYGDSTWCWEQKDREQREQDKKEQDKKEQEKRDQEKREWDRKAWEKDHQNKEYWNRQAQEREYLNKQYWDKQYRDRKQRDKEYWDRRDRARRN